METCCLYRAHKNTTLVSHMHQMNVAQILISFLGRLIFRRVCKIAKSDYYFRHVCMSVRVEQLASHWTDCDETLYFSSPLRISVKKIHVSLKSDKNNGNFALRRFHIYDSILLNYFWN